MEKLVAEGEQIPQQLPSLGNLKEAVKKAKEWMARAETIKNPDNFPYIDSMETLVARGRPLPVKLEALTHLETQVAQARAWRERTARVFLKKSNRSGKLLIFYFCFLFCEISRWPVMEEDIILFRSIQQLSCLGLKPLKGFFS